MKDYSCDDDFKQKRNAIHADFLHIKECLAVHKGFEEAATKYIEKDKTYKSPGCKPFHDFVKDSMDHVIIIHLWNLIGNKKNNKHNLCAYMKDVQNNIDDYVRTFMSDEMDEMVEGFVDPVKEIKDNIECFEKYHSSLNIKGVNSFYNRLERWRNRIFAHFDQDTETDRFMPKVNGPGPSKWQTENRITYSEIETVFAKLWDQFHAIDRTVLRLHYEPQPIACDVMKFMIDKSEIKKN